MIGMSKKKRLFKDKRLKWLYLVGLMVCIVLAIVLIIKRINDFASILGNMLPERVHNRDCKTKSKKMVSSIIFGGVSVVIVFTCVLGYVLKQSLNVHTIVNDSEYAQIAPDISEYVTKKEYSMIVGNTNDSENIISDDIAEFAECEKKINDIAESVIESYNPEDFFEDTMQNSDSNEDKYPEDSKVDYRLPGTVYIHIYEDCEIAPEVLNEPISDEDIAVDISYSIDPTTKFDVSAEVEFIIACVVYREANTQSFLGQVLVAEDIVNRIRSGLYGNDINAILVSGYEAVLEADGLHIYRGNGKEITEPDEAAATATRIALNGSNFSNTILKVISEERNKQFGLELGDIYYCNGALYHYNPDLVSEKQLRAREFRRVPVCFRVEEHIFYGHWLPKASALDI